MPNDGTASAGARTSLGAEPLALTWKPLSGMVGVSFVNFVLRILTLGIYHFWGKTEVRRRIWSAMRLNGEPLEYTGTGKELFIGFLVVFFAIFLPITLISSVLAYGQQTRALAIFQVAAFVAFYFLVGFGTHRALRYRLSRTRWRGIRGGLEGSSLRYAWTYFWTTLLIPFTLGWIMPWRATKLQGLITNDMRFGNRPFCFGARSGPLYGRFAIVWVGSLILFGAATAVVVAASVSLRATRGPGAGPSTPPDPTLLGLIMAAMIGAYIIFGIIIAWYQAAIINHFAVHTTYEGATFKGNATAGSLIWLVISNMLIVILTLGLLAPVAQARAARYMVDRLSIDGAVPLAEIAQRAEDPMRRGEGLAQVFDVDAF